MKAIMPWNAIMLQIRWILIQQQICPGIGHTLLIGWATHGFLTSLSWKKKWIEIASNNNYTLLPFLCISITGWQSLGKKNKHRGFKVLFDWLCTLGAVTANDTIMPLYCR